MSGESGQGGKGQADWAERTWATFFAAFFDSLRKDLGTAAGDDLEPTVRARLAELEKQRGEWVRYPQDNQSFMLMSMVLAAYQVLRDRVDRDAAITALRHAFTLMWGDWIRAGTKAQLDAAPDPFVSMTTTARTKEESTFGPSFVFEHERDDQNAYWVKVTRCLYHSYFVAHGVPELTPVFCDWDANWASAIEPARHGFRFERPTTLGFGGDGCYFRHTRESTTARAES